MSSHITISSTIPLSRSNSSDSFSDSTHHYPRKREYAKPIPLIHLPCCNGMINPDYFPKIAKVYDEDQRCPNIDCNKSISSAKVGELLQQLPNKISNRYLAEFLEVKRALLKDTKSWGDWALITAHLGKAYEILGKSSGRVAKLYKEALMKAPDDGITWSDLGKVFKAGRDDFEIEVNGKSESIKSKAKCFELAENLGYETEEAGLSNVESDAESNTNSENADNKISFQPFFIKTPITIEEAPRLENKNNLCYFDSALQTLCRMIPEHKLEDISNYSESKESEIAQILLQLKNCSNPNQLRDRLFKICTQRWPGEIRPGEQDAADVVITKLLEALDLAEDFSKIKIQKTLIGKYGSEILQQQSFFDEPSHGFNLDIPFDLQIPINANLKNSQGKVDMEAAIQNHFQAERIFGDVIFDQHQDQPPIQNPITEKKIVNRFAPQTIAIAFKWNAGHTSRPKLQLPNQELIHFTPEQTTNQQELIYQMDTLICWDGTYRDNHQSAGHYFVLAKGINPQQESVWYKLDDLRNSSEPQQLTESQLRQAAEKTVYAVARRLDNPEQALKNFETLFSDQDSNLDSDDLEDRLSRLAPSKISSAALKNTLSKNTEQTRLLQQRLGIVEEMLKQLVNSQNQPTNPTDSLEKYLVDAQEWKKGIQKNQQNIDRLDQDNRATELLIKKMQNQLGTLQTEAQEIKTQNDQLQQTLSDISQAIPVNTNKNPTLLSDLAESMQSNSMLQAATPTTTNISTTPTAPTTSTITTTTTNTSTTSVDVQNALQQKIDAFRNARSTAENTQLTLDQAEEVLKAFLTKHQKLINKNWLQAKQPNPGKSSATTSVSNPWMIKHKLKSNSKSIAGPILPKQDSLKDFLRIQHQQTRSAQEPYTLKNDLAPCLKHLGIEYIGSLDNAVQLDLYRGLNPVSEARQQARTVQLSLDQALLVLNQFLMSHRTTVASHNLISLDNDDHTGALGFRVRTNTSGPQGLSLETYLTSIHDPSRSRYTLEEDILPCLEYLCRHGLQQMTFMQQADLYNYINVFR